MKYACIAAVAAAVIAATPATAAVQVTTKLANGATIAPPRSFAVGADFTQDASATALFQFTLAGAQTLSASIFSTDAISDAAFGFTSLSLFSGAIADYNASNTALQSSTTAAPMSTGGSSISLGKYALKAGTYTVALVGNARSDASVGGSISFESAVPEPATWAMMLLGFGMVGAASRYRRKGTRVAYA